MAVVEGRRRTREICHVVGGCIGVCPRGSVFHQPVLLPELRHPVELARKITPHRRLSLREQGELWPTHTRNSIDHAIDPTHPASGGLQVVCGMATLGLSTRQGTGKGGAQRHRGVQLSRRRHPLLGSPISGCRLLSDVLRHWLSGISRAPESRFALL